jgi:hypothetical protein
MTKRDDFSQKTIRILAGRAGNMCSNPDCRISTTGAASGNAGVVTVGVAAHIKAAAPLGPRYDPQQTPLERSHADNGIWLCQIHAKQIDDDDVHFTVEILKGWKKAAEERSARSITSLQASQGAIEGLSDSFPLASDLQNATTQTGFWCGLAVTGLSAFRKSTSVATRFILLFENHGVHRNQIPGFFGHGITLADLQSETALLLKLDETILNAVCTKFAVRREWIDGADDQAYFFNDFYKYPEDFLRFIEAIHQADEQSDLFGYLIVPIGTSYEGADSVLILQEAIGAIGEKIIFRYHLCNNWSFSYWKSRAFLAACIAIAWKNSVWIQGRYADAKFIAALWAGETLLGSGSGACKYTNLKRWYAEDLALVPSVYLDGIDPETGDFGIRSALQLWLDLDKQGYMDTGLTCDARSLFRAAHLECHNRTEGKHDVVQ